MHHDSKATDPGAPSIHVSFVPSESGVINQITRGVVQSEQNCLYAIVSLLLLRCSEIIAKVEYGTNNDKLVKIKNKKKKERFNRPNKISLKVKKVTYYMKCNLAR